MLAIIIMQLFVVIGMALWIGILYIYLVKPKNEEPQKTEDVPEIFRGSNGLFTNKVISNKEEDDERKHIRG